MAAIASNNDITTTNNSHVMSLINKHLRALSKKFNCILTTEEAITQGKPLNKEQEEVLHCKPSMM